MADDFRDLLDSKFRGRRPAGAARIVDEALSDTKLPRSRLRSAVVEFFGTMTLTYVTAGAVLATGVISMKYDLVEVTPGRLLAIALANALVS